MTKNINTLKKRPDIKMGFVGSLCLICLNMIDCFKCEEEKDGCNLYIINIKIIIFIYDVRDSEKPLGWGLWESIHP